MASKPWGRGGRGGALPTTLRVLSGEPTQAQQRHVGLKCWVEGSRSHGQCVSMVWSHWIGKVATVSYTQSQLPRRLRAAWAAE